MVDDAAQRQAEGDGQQLLLHHRGHLPVAVDGALEVEAGAGDLDLVADRGLALAHLDVGLELGAHAEVLGALLVVAGVQRAAVGHRGRGREVGAGVAAEGGQHRDVAT